MKKIIYISTIGMEKKTNQLNLGPFSSGINGIAPQDIEKVFLLTEQEEKTTSTLIVQQFPYLKQKIECIPIDIFNYETLIHAVLRIFEDLPKNVFKFIVNITGGTKIMSLGAFMGAVLIGAEIHYIKESTDTRINPELKKIKMPKIPVNDMHPFQRAILYVMNTNTKEKGLHQCDIRDELQNQFAGKKNSPLGKKEDVSGQIVNHHCKILEESGYITRESKEKNRKGFIYVLSTIGAILANFIKF
jgi:hypothetical protein